MKKKKIIIGIVCVIIIAAICSALFGKKEPETSETDDKSNAEKILDSNTDIIWKTDDKMGILNLELDGTKTKEGIISQYYTDLSSYLKTLNKDSLNNECDYIEIVGNVVKDGKIECAIKGNLNVDFIKTDDNLSPAHLESNMQDLFIPEALQ